MEKLVWSNMQEKKQNLTVFETVLISEPYFTSDIQ